MSIKLRNLASEVRSRVQQSDVVLSPNSNIVYVDSGNANAGTGRDGTDPKNPLSTIDSALTVGTSGIAANNGDVVIVMPGHTESISGATTLVPDVAGVSILGIGRGSDRPTLTYTATDGEIPISGANTVFSNFLLTISGTTDVVVGITVSGADVLLDDIEMRQPTATDEFVDAVILAAGANRCEIGGFKFNGIAQGGATQTAITTPAAITTLNIHDLWAVGTFASGAIENETAEALDVVIQRVIIEQRHASQDACINMMAATKGFIADAYLRTATDDDAGMGAVDADDMQMYNVRVVNADGEYGAADEVSDLDVTNTRSGHTFSTIA